MRKIKTSDLWTLVAITAGVVLLGGSVIAGGLVEENPQLRELDRLEQTARDLRSLSLTCEAFHTDNGAYPGPTEGTLPVEFLRTLVWPMYIRTFPAEDGWGHPLLFWSDGESYRILSHGGDGVGGGTGFGEDVILENGAFASPPFLREPADQLELLVSTMKRIRTVALTVETYAVDEGRYPGPTDGNVSADFLREFVEPVYIRTLAASDAWGHPLLYWSDGKSYRIASLGQNGRQDRPFDETAAANRITGDIVFQDGRFLHWPEGPQQ